MAQEKDNDSQSAAGYALDQVSDLAEGLIDGLTDAFNPFTSGGSSGKGDSDDEE